MMPEIRFEKTVWAAKPTAIPATPAEANITVATFFNDS